MIWGTWQDPNYEFVAIDGQGHRHEHIAYAATKAELDQRLQDRTLTVVSIDDYDFAEWKKRARDAARKAIGQRVKGRWVHFRPQASAYFPWLTNAELDDIGGDLRKLATAIAAHDGVDARTAEGTIDAWFATLTEERGAPGQPVEKTAISFPDKVWKELTWHLFELFHGKCAYCETKPLASDVGDVEHYRPKGKVDEDPDHPGYYWLAYDETNLLPSCAYCNRYRKSKQTRFPVVGTHAREAKSLATEQPLLLNPYNHALDPFKHIEFNERGVSAARDKSQFGDSSRTVYYLDRPGLGEARYEAMRAVEQDWNGRVSTKVGIGQAFSEVRDAILSGNGQYSAARLWALERLMNRTVTQLLGLGSLVPFSTPNPPPGAPPQTPPGAAPI